MVAQPIEPNVDERMAQIREANEHLVVVAVRAQALTEEAERTSHQKDEFLAMVSHEIRTPLNAVMGWVQLLESKQLSPERAEHAIAAIGRSASALAHMIDDLLDTSRILKGAIRLAMGPVDLVAVAQGDVSIESADNHLEVRVVDTGRGISPDFLPTRIRALPSSRGRDHTTSHRTGPRAWHRP